MAKFTDAERTQLEAAAFRRLVDHLRQRNDVQNIDLMNLAGFCRNCLSIKYKLIFYDIKPVCCFAFSAFFKLESG